jgi:hypothetical protein
MIKLKQDLEMKQLITVVIISYLLTSCGVTDKPKEKVVSKNDLPIEKVITSTIRQPTSIKYSFLDSTESFLSKKLDSLYSKVPFFTTVNNSVLLYVCNGDWTERTYDELQYYPNGDNLKFGIINKQMEVLLPIEYDKIYNPDLTAKGYIEIESNGFLGLYNYKTNHLIECEFDNIFPSNNEAIAIGSINNQYYEILENENALILDSNEIPKYSEILKNHHFDALDTNITYLIDSYYTYYDGDPIEGNGVVVTPSYLNKLNILPEIQPNIIIKREGDFGIIESEIKITESSSFGEKVTAFISSFYEEGVDGRGYQLNQNHFFTINDRNEVVTNQLMSENFNNNEYYFCENGDPTLVFINDTLIELRKMVSNPDDYPRYRTMPEYSYYSINSMGQMEQLKTHRYFDFTKYVKLNPSYFGGCFTQYTENNKEYNYGEVYLLTHLNIADLDIMRNEIFAAYGYKFNSEKWIKYFQGKDWYSPQYENVDEMLTETDKHNIELILRVKEVLKTTNSKTINKTKFEFGMAG